MKTKVLDDSAERTIALIFDAGEEAMDGIARYAEEHGLHAARFTAIGAFSEVTLGYFDVERRDYERIAIAEQVEVLSLLGDIALHEGKPKVHAHVVVGKRDGSAHGGHLLAGRVRPTLECILVESPAYLVRRYDPRFGLPLIDPDMHP